MSVSRRDFLKGSAFIMGGAMAGLAGAASAFGADASGSASASGSVAASGSASASAAPAEGGNKVTLHRGYAAAHGDKCFTQVVVATADDGTVLAVNVDDYQFMDATTEGVVPVPNSDAKLGSNYPDGMVLASKTDSNTAYSAHMAEKGGATQEWVVSMQAIEDYCIGKTPYELVKTAADGISAKEAEEAAAAAASGSASSATSAAAAGSVAASAAASAPASAAASAAPASASASAAPASAAASAPASAAASAAASATAGAAAASGSEEPIVVDTITGATLEDRYSYVGAVGRIARDTNIIATGTYTGDGSDLMIGRTLAAAHGESAFCSAVTLVQGDTIVATSIDEFQFMGSLAPLVYGVPNSTGAFGENYPEGKLLASKSVNSDIYSAHMEEEAQATTRWYDSMSAIEADMAGMTFEQAGGIDGPDAVSGATLEDTAGYAAAAVTAAQAAM